METKKTLISIIVPVYNTEKYIERCLDSIMKQDYPNFEVILVNDGSTDYCECKREFEMWLAHTIIQNTQIYCEQVVDTKVFKKYVGELVKLYYKGGI